MGTRALKEIENLYRLRLGLPPKDSEPSGTKSATANVGTSDGMKHEGE
jgi:hypothetical protein